MMKEKNKAQTFIEYGVLIALLVVALITIKIYFSRAVQEKYRQTADVFGQGDQYAKGVTVVADLDAPGRNIPASNRPEDICPNIIGRVNALDNEINLADHSFTDLNGQRHSVQGLRGLVNEYNQSAQQIRSQIANLQSQGGKVNFTEQISQLEASAKVLEEKARELSDKIEEKNEEIEGLKRNYSYCFE